MQINYEDHGKNYTLSMPNEDVIIIAPEESSKEKTILVAKRNLPSQEKIWDPAAPDYKVSDESGNVKVELLAINLFDAILSGNIKTPVRKNMKQALLSVYQKNDKEASMAIAQKFIEVFQANHHLDEQLASFYDFFVSPGFKLVEPDLRGELLIAMKKKDVGLTVSKKLLAEQKNFARGSPEKQESVALALHEAIFYGIASGANWQIGKKSKSRKELEKMVSKLIGERDLAPLTHSWLAKALLLFPETAKINSAIQLAKREDLSKDAHQDVIKLLFTLIPVVDDLKKRGECQEALATFLKRPDLNPTQQKEIVNNLTTSLSRDLGFYEENTPDFLIEAIEILLSNKTLLKSVKILLANKLIAAVKDVHIEKYQTKVGQVIEKSIGEDSFYATRLFGELLAANDKTHPFLLDVAKRIFNHPVISERDREYMKSLWKTKGLKPSLVPDSLPAGVLIGEKPVKGRSFGTLKIKSGNSVRTYVVSPLKTVGKDFGEDSYRLVFRTMQKLFEQNPAADRDLSKYSVSLRKGEVTVKCKNKEIKVDLLNNTYYEAERKKLLEQMREDFKSSTSKKKSKAGLLKDYNEKQKQLYPYDFVAFTEKDLFPGLPN